MNCSCLYVLLVYATRRTANCVALAILIGTYQLVNDIRTRSGNACVRILAKLKRQQKRKCQRKTKTKTKMILKTKQTLLDRVSLLHYIIMSPLR